MRKTFLVFLRFFNFLSKTTVNPLRQKERPFLALFFFVWSAHWRSKPGWPKKQLNKNAAFSVQQTPYPHKKRCLFHYLIRNSLLFGILKRTPEKEKKSWVKFSVRETCWKKQIWFEDKVYKPRTDEKRFCFHCYVKQYDSHDLVPGACDFPVFIGS